MVYIFSQERGAAEFLWKDIDHFLSSYICSAGTKFFPYIVYSIIVFFPFCSELFFTYNSHKYLLSLQEYSCEGI